MESTYRCILKYTMMNDLPWCLKIDNDDEHHLSSFGCDMAPGFHVREISDEGKVSLPGPPCVLLIVSLSSVLLLSPWHCSVVILCLSKVSWDEHGMGGAYRGAIKYKTTMNIVCHCLVAISPPGICVRDE